MEFSVSALHDLEEKILNLSDTLSAQINGKKLEDVTIEQLKSRNVTKDALAGIVVKMGTMFSDTKIMLRSALEKLDEQKSDLLKNQKLLIQTQNELIKCKSGKLESVQETVKSEIKSFSDAVKKNCSSMEISPAKIKMAVKSAITEEDRSKNFIIFGAEEKLLCEEQDMNEQDLVNDIFGFMKDLEKPAVTKCERVGIKNSTSARRPIKVTLRDREAVHQVLRRAKVLRTIDVAGYNFRYSDLYLSPDRSQDERIVRQKLVQEMKERIKKDSRKRYHIRNYKSCIAD